jgi:hypothetical protein
MKRLIYTSTARRAMSDTDIPKILSVSRLNNKIYNITGMLIYHDRRFLQILEGKGEDLNATYRRIKNDWRHTDCKRLLEETIVSRAFSGWNMAHQNHQELLAQQQLQLVDIGRLILGLSEDELKENSALYVFLKAFLSNFEMPRAA